MKKIKVAAVQMDSAQDLNKNLDAMIAFVLRAVKKKADIIVFPEYCFYRGKTSGLGVASEFVKQKAFPALKFYAEKNSVCIVAGSAPEAVCGKNKFYNTSFVLNSGNKSAAKYRKIHLFKAVTDKTIDENKIYETGEKVSMFSFKGHRVGQALCFDLRFSSFFQNLSQRRAEVVVMPSDFTAFTGKAHWETLVRARSIEWQIFMITPNQWGKNPATGVKSYGHSMITDPWGNILAQAPARGDSVLIAELDFDFQKKVRRRISMR